MTQYISKGAKLFAELLENGRITASAVDQGSQETKAQFETPIATGIIKKQRLITMHQLLQSTAKGLEQEAFLI